MAGGVVELAEDLVCVFAGLGRGASGLRAIAVETDREGDLSVIGDARMRSWIEDAGGGDLGIVDDLRNILDRGTGDAVFFKERAESCGRAPTRVRCEDAREFLAVGDAGGVGAEAWIVGDFGDFERFAEALEDAVVAGEDHEIAVLGWEGFVGSDHGEAGAGAVGNFAAREVAGQVVADPNKRGGEEGGFDVRPLAGLVAFAEGGEDAESGPHACADVDDSAADAGGRSVGMAGHRHDAAVGLDERIVARGFAQGAFGAEAGDRGVDQLGPAGAELLVAETQRFDDALAKGLHEDIGRFAKAVERLAPAGRLQVERDAAFVAVPGEEERRFAFPKGRSPGSRRIAGKGFDFDDVGAEVAEDLRAVGSSEVLRKIDDADVFEGVQGINVLQGGSDGFGTPVICP